MSTLQAEGRSGKNRRVTAQQRLEQAREAVRAQGDGVITKDWELTSSSKTAVNKTGAYHIVYVTAIDLGKLDGSQKHSYAYVCRHADLAPESSTFLKCLKTSNTGARGQYGTGVLIDASQALSQLLRSPQRVSSEVSRLIPRIEALVCSEIYNASGESILAQATAIRSSSAAVSTMASQGAGSSATPRPLSRPPSVSRPPADLSSRRSSSTSRSASVTSLQPSKGFTAINSRPMGSENPGGSRVNAAGGIAKPYQAVTTAPVAALTLSRVTTVLDYPPVPPHSIPTARASTPQRTPTPARSSNPQPTASGPPKRPPATAGLTRPLRPPSASRELRSSKKPLEPAVNTRRSGGRTPTPSNLPSTTRGPLTNSAAVTPPATRTLRSASRPTKAPASVLDGTAVAADTPLRRSDRLYFQSL